MSEPQNIIISSRDYALLQGLVIPPCAERDLLAGMVRQRLNHAIVAFPADIGPDVVGVGSFVRYRVNGLRSEATTLVATPRPEPGCLPLLSVHGLALLGLSVGQSLVVQPSDAAQQLIAVEEVRREPAPRVPMPGLASRGPRVLAFRPRPPAIAHAFSGGGDDPGPSAA